MAVAMVAAATVEEGMEVTATVAVTATAVVKVRVAAARRVAARVGTEAAETAGISSVRHSQRSQWRWHTEPRHHRGHSASLGHRPGRRRCARTHTYCCTTSVAAMAVARVAAATVEAVEEVTATVAVTAMVEVEVTARVAVTATAGVDVEDNYSW